MAIEATGLQVHKQRWIIALAGVLVAGLALRLYGLNWDEGHLFHPDERMIVFVVERLAWPTSLAQFLSVDSPLNPKFFAYGSFPIYLLKLVSTLFSPLRSSGLLAAIAGPSYDGLALAGRLLNVLFDTGMVALVFVLGRKLYGERTGLLAAAFGAFAVLPIQLAHFYAVDTLLTFLVVLTVVCGAQVMTTGSYWWGVALGASLGLALATKASAFPLLMMVIGPWLLWLIGKWQSESRPDGSAPTLGRGALVGAGPSPEGAEGTALLVLRALQGFVGAAISLAVVVIVFFAAQPYALIDWPSFRQATLEQSGIARGLLDYPYTRQYLNTPAFIYQIWQTSLFGLGLPLGLLAFGGLVFIAGRGIFRPSRADWLLLAWVVPYFLVIGGLQAKYLRYMLPLVPFLCLFGAEMIWGSTVRWQRLKFIVGWLVVFLSLAYSLAFANVYSNHHTWLRASTWIYRNIPAGSSLAIELWDDALPTRMVIDGERRGGSEYRWRQMDLYAPDTPAKLDQLVRDLARSDYIVLASQRLYASIARLPDRYPITTRYYELLFGEKLGFRLVTFEATYPSLLGVTLMDDTTADLLPTPSLLTYYRPSPIVLHLGRADESFTVYDHPKPLVFQKAQRFSEQELHRLLAGE